MWPRWSIWSSVTVLVWVVVRSLTSFPASKECTVCRARIFEHRRPTRIREDPPMAELRWEPPDPSANAAWLDLLATCERVDRWGEIYTEPDLDDEWRSVWVHPERDGRFVWDRDQLVGFAWPKVIPGQRDHHRVDLWGAVRPSHRRLGIGAQLFDWQVARGAAALGELDPTIRSKLAVHAHPE